MRNIAVIVHEFGQTSRNNDSSHGIILVNESVDDQRLIYWTKGCLESEKTSKETEYEKCLKVVILPPLKAGTSSDVFEQAASGERCSSCDTSTWCTHQKGMLVHRLRTTNSFRSRENILIFIISVTLQDRTPLQKKERTSWKTVRSSCNKPSGI